MVVFDRNLTWVASEKDKNYDVIFVESHDTNSIQDPDLVRCVVELKGGSDSAGADEHYTTAEGKLRRIHEVQQDGIVVDESAMLVSACGAVGSEVEHTELPTARESGVVAALVWL